MRVIVPESLVLVAALCLLLTGCHSPGHPCNHSPRSDSNGRWNRHKDARYWLHNMVAVHGYSNDEIAAATGLGMPCVEKLLDDYDISRDERLPRPENARLLIAPYPGGRHPRIGFLDGAIDPQRETKVSIFLPWDMKSYVVYDVPEAIWSNLGLTYLAHKHIATIWDDQGIKLGPNEWTRHSDGSLELNKTLPNKISFGTKVVPTGRMVTVDFWIRNGTAETLTGLRTQMCLMLSRAEGFNQLANENKVMVDPYVACKSPDGDRWIITAFTHCQRPWANEIVPCMHSDPQLPDCPPGETVRTRGMVSFYEGTDIESEFLRLENTGWREMPEP